VKASGALLDIVWSDCVRGGCRRELLRSMADKECVVWGVGNSDESLKLALVVPSCE
jgi:hypothetical protein